MQLEVYLDKYSISLADFARQIGAKSRSTVYRYKNGTRIPDKDAMAKISEVTAGQVTANDFYEPVAGAQP